MFLVKGKKAIKRNYQIIDTISADLSYQLTNIQQNASKQILKCIKNNQSVIVNAVCGSGKTELVYETIEYFLNNNKIIAFAIPRKDVVNEIYHRLIKDYPTVDISMVCGGNTNKLEGQIVVLTTHQLFRYEDYFDLLILDEADAFPYYENELLNVFLKKSCKGLVIYLSATMKSQYLNECEEVVYVNRRFHNKDLPVPKIVKYNKANSITILNKTIESLRGKPILIFVPTIDCGKKLEKKLNCPFVYSSYKYKEKYINEFKENKINILITTSILERGMTFFDVQVIVYDAQHDLFDESSLIQISGRVGRKLKAPTGNVYFLATKITSSMRKCIKTIKIKNRTIV